MKNYINLVQQFSQKGQIPHLKGDVTKKEISFTTACLFEEYMEYKAAKEANDKEEMLDAFLDICYFACNLANIFNLKKLCIDNAPEKIKPLNRVLGKISAKDKKGLVWLLTNAFYSAKQEAEKIGDFDGSFKHVHQKNMEKYTTSGPDAVIGAGMAKENKGLEATYEKVKDYYIVFAWVNGYKRILKPDGWTAPDLKPYLK